MPTKGFMDTNAKAVMVSKRRGPYWHHPLALKWAIVEETLQPGASVAQIARNHGVNTNQVFLWRKSYRKGLLPEPKPTLLPVTLTPQRVSNPLPAVSSSGPCSVRMPVCTVPATGFRIVRAHVCPPEV